MTEQEKSLTPGKDLATKSGESGADPPEKPEQEKNPTALDVIQTLINPQEEEKASVHMKGHISKTLIEDTFLFETTEIYPE